MSDKNALHEKLKNMTSEEIFKHLRAAETANRLVSAAGITALFAMLVYPNAVTILFTTVVVYMLSNMGSDISKTIEAIEQYILDNDK